MSSKLVKKSLELFEADFSSAVESGKKKKKKEQNPMALISTKKRGVKKELLRLQNQRKQDKQRKDKSKMADNSLFYQPEDFTEASVSSLCKVSKVSKVGEKTTSAILNYHLSKNRKERIKKKELKKKKMKEQEQSVFTDEDFEKFFLEYNDPLNTG